MKGGDWIELAQFIENTARSFQQGLQQAQPVPPPKKAIPGPMRGPGIKEAVVLDIRDGEDDPEDV